MSEERFGLYELKWCKAKMNIQLRKRVESKICHSCVVNGISMNTIEEKSWIEKCDQNEYRIEGKKLNWKMPEGRWPQSCCPRGPACPPPPASSQLLDCQDDDDADHDGITGIPWFQCALYCFVLQFLLTSSHNEDGNMCAWPIGCHEALFHVPNTNTNTNTLI